MATQTTMTGGHLPIGSGLGLQYRPCVAICGDGMIKGDEACDDGQESDLCNAIAPSPFVGWLVNVTAGETDQVR